MCDNCRQDLHTVIVDRSEEALQVYNFIEECGNYRNYLTLKQCIEIMRGKKPQKNYLNPQVLQRYSGNLKHMSEKDIRRMIIQLLIKKVLKEQFQK